MTSPFDADDMMSRGLFASIMGFRKKNRPPEQNLNVLRPSPVALCSSRTLTERTPNDIFREIVSECDYIERSTNTTPFSDLASCPTSPNSFPSINTPFDALSPATVELRFNAETQPEVQMEPTMNQHVNHQQQQQQQNVVPISAPYDPYLPYVSPPPYSPCQIFPQLQYPNPPPQIMVSPDGETQSPILLEDVVKMVVNAMRQSSIDGEIQKEKETPEEILRRKRQQNNEAAARYRKRQRDARERADGEFEELSRKNENLKDTVARMEREIEQLKRAVLQGK